MSQLSGANTQHRVLRITSVLGLLALLVASCAPTAPAAGSPATTAQPATGPAATAAAVTPQPQVALKKVTISTVAPITTLDYTAPQYNGVPVRQGALLGSGGYLYSFQPNGSLEPDLAADFPKVADNKLSMTVSLRSGLKYSDGTAVDAEDVVTAFGRTKKGPHASRLVGFDSAQASDERTIVFKLNAPVDIQTQAGVLSYWIPVHPRARVSDSKYFEKPVSASRYTITDWTPGGSAMVLQANPSYWRGKPAIEQIVLQSATDPTSRVLQVTTGQADVAFDIPASAVKQLPAEAKSLVVPIGGVFWIGIRTDVPGALGDVRVRQAICLAVDRGAINTRAFLGNAEPVAAPLSRYQPGWKYEPILPGNGARDVATAKKLLTEAGYAQGFSFPLQTWGARPGWTDAAVVISENLKDLGITAKVEPIEDAVAIANLTNSKFDAQFSGGGGDTITTLTTLYSPDGFWAKATRFNQPEVSGLVDQLRRTTDTAAAQKLQVDLLKLAWDKSATICPLNERAIVAASRVPTSALQFVAAEQLFYVGTLK
jgi:peptide/nickel transport system substrate-binding protein